MDAKQQRLLRYAESFFEELGEPGWGRALEGCSKRGAVGNLA
jgi:hypothetical protein